MLARLLFTASPLCVWHLCLHVYEYFVGHSFFHCYASLCFAFVWHHCNLRSNAIKQILSSHFRFFLLLFLTISLALSVFLLNFKLDFYALELFIADVDATVAVFVIVIVIGSHYNFAHFIYTYCTHTHTLFSGKFGVTLRV